MNTENKQEDLEKEVENLQEEQNNEKVEEISNEQDLLKQKEQECRDYIDKLQRNIAEFDNYRKRTTLEKGMMYDNGAADTIVKILPVIDNLDRAVQTSPANENEAGILNGVNMVLKQFKEILNSIGVEEIKGVGEQFDPQYHNAVTHVEDENFGENEVAEEFQKGYVYKHKVIRHSMVKVAN